MNDRRDDESENDDRLNGAVTEASSELVHDDPEDHLDYSTCSKCGRTYRTGETHTCPSEKR